jgi:dTDP-4-amino-4,6-dideoxygalactose transaminase
MPANPRKLKAFDSAIEEEDLAPILEILRKGELGFGPKVGEFEKEFASFSNKRYNIATNSASAAAFMIFAYLRSHKGKCDVYTTSLGFTSPAWAAAANGHRVIFVDVDENLQFSTQDYKTKRTLPEKHLQTCRCRPVVLMPVLYGGVSTIEGFEPYGDEIIVVDSAHCVTPTIKADFLFFSFHPYKPICSPDGGLIATGNTSAVTYLRNYRNFGRVSAGNSYDIKHDGFKFYMNNLSAAVALTQLPHYDKKLAHRKSNYKKWAEQYTLLPQDEKSSYYLATTLVDNANELLNTIGVARHYPMLHQTTYYGRTRKISLPRLEDLHSKILNLPLYEETI